MSSDRRRTAALTAALASLAIAGGSCNVRPRVIHPTFPDGGMLRDATPLTQHALSGLEGFYEVQLDRERFGRNVAMRASPGRLSFFGGVEANFAILEAGCLDGGKTLVLEGAWRYATTTDTGLVRLFVGPEEDAQTLCEGRAVRDIRHLTFTGTTGDGYDLPSTEIRFDKPKTLADSAGKFLVIAHHGTQTVEDLGASENTIESFRLAQALGADSIEVDIRMTKDGIPILFHDGSLSPRLVEGRFCRGSVSDLTFAQIRANCRSEYGEPVYSLEEGLLGIIDQTTFGGVWLDVKETVGVAPTLEVMARAEEHALAAGRDVAFVVGLSSQDHVDAYLAASPPEGTKCIVEFDPDVALSTGCGVWGPRFTEGPQPERVAAAQADGLAVIFWTVNGPAFMEQFLGHSQPNGIISDMPGYAFYFYQANTWVPKGGKPEGPHGHGPK